MSSEEAGEFVEPGYGRRSLVDLLPAVGSALDADAGFAQVELTLPCAQGYVVLLVDGLGHELLRAHPDEAPYLHGLLAGQPPGTAGVPSTTATSLTSFGTALRPGEHGVVGFTSRIPGTNRLLNALQWDKRVDPREWQPHPTAFARLAAAGVHTTVVNKREFAGSGLTLAGQRGAEYVGADRPGEQIAAVLAAARAPRSLTYCYDSDLDWTGHRYGVASAQWRQQLSVIDATARHLREQLPGACRLLVVADHGMVDCPPASRLDVDDHAVLREGLALLGGEARFRHLYCRRGAVEDVVAAWTQQVDSRAVVLTREDAVRRGWFGPLSADVRPRIGDVLVAARGDFGVFSSADFAHEARLVGLHGSLTPAEMLVPLLLD